MDKLIPWLLTGALYSPLKNKTILIDLFNGHMQNFARYLVATKHVWKYLSYILLVESNLQDHNLIN